MHSMAPLVTLAVAPLALKVAGAAMLFSAPVLLWFFLLGVLSLDQRAQERDRQAKR